jgi:hypothetical protein
MKSIMLISALLVLVVKLSFSQKTESTKILCQKTVTQKPSCAKKQVAKKISRIDSLLTEREFRLGEEEPTKDVDLELSKMAYAPKVVVQENKGGFSFTYFQFINDLERKAFEEKLLNSCKINTLSINTSQMSCRVSFKNEANEQDKNEFFKAFGYNGIIYRD